MALDEQAEKQEVTEFLTAFTGLMGQMQPLAASGLMPAEAVKGMVLFAIRRWKVSREVEEMLMTIGQGETGPSAEQIKAEGEEKNRQLKAMIEQGKRQQEKLETVVELLDVVMKHSDAGDAEAGRLMARLLQDDRERRAADAAQIPAG